MDIEEQTEEFTDVYGTVVRAQTWWNVIVRENQGHDDVRSFYSKSDAEAYAAGDYTQHGTAEDDRDT